jgi:hypothetical protein
LIIAINSEGHSTHAKKHKWVIPTLHPELCECQEAHKRGIQLIAFWKNLILKHEKVLTQMYTIIMVTGRDFNLVTCVREERTIKWEAELN